MARKKKDSTSRSSNSKQRTKKSRVTKERPMVDEEYPIRINDCCGETIVFKLADDLYFEVNAEHGQIFHWKECGKPRLADYDQVNKFVEEWLMFRERNKHWLKIEHKPGCNYGDFVKFGDSLDQFSPSCTCAVLATQIYSQVIYLIQDAREADPSIRLVYWFPDMKEIRLIYVSDETPLPVDNKVYPFYFQASPEDRLPLPSCVAYIRREEIGKVLVPDDWGCWENSREFL